MLDQTRKDLSTHRLKRAEELINEAETLFDANIDIFFVILRKSFFFFHIARILDFMKGKADL